MRELEARLNLLEGLSKHDEAIKGLETKRKVTDSIKDVTRVTREQAEFHALKSVVSDLSVRAGVPNDRFERVFKERFQILQDYFLQFLADRDKSTAAQADTRNLDEIPTSREFPPLFEDQNGTGDE